MLESIRAFFESLAGMILLVFFGLLIFSAAMIVCALKMPGNDASICSSSAPREIFRGRSSPSSTSGANQFKPNHQSRK